MKCPNCGSKNVGKIGGNLFYCRDCFCEIKVKGNKFVIKLYDHEGRIKRVQYINV
ncbi:hypothetical protein [Thermoanaerobacterium thermosaccharolyticum]|uniref:Uncharacterized protein n=1 Tax=Thermoanaerobacterium thermosaccharolyticum (strain ATCC 7956 / DSM 571 / NCIMB 9385 / NCA 3814 / NCTC 13789 / WDCM 00135 / 2032) TaxID=580327 RepID=D9TLV4_THETC|nr:hypothetical protein [Thermoanaerobacterium thermosaccharolyticum]ADL69452.1 conserved hypothetical protein [Thermoanaerobacterium thermosaccharolyticum DSM 571]TCW39453.1 hypothetical protein EDC21_10512 [Thermohydrogenium kirishiense]